MTQQSQSFVNPATHPDITGHFDMVAHEQALGWAYDPEQPSRRVTIKILCDEDIVACGCADRFREDLLAAGIGDGYCHFALPLSYELFDGQMHSLLAQEEETETVLLGGPYIFGSEHKRHPFDVLTRKEGAQLLNIMLQQPEFSAFAHQAHDLIWAYRSASLLQETGQFSESRNAYASMLKILGDHALCHCKIGETYLLEGMYSQALEAYRAAAAVDSCFPWAHLGIGHTQRLLGQSIEAEDAYQIALGLQPENAAARQWLNQAQQQSIPMRVDALIARGETDAAIVLLKQRMIEKPDDVAIANQLGQVLLRQDPPTYDASLPGLSELHEFQQAQRLLELVLADAEALLIERA